MFVTLVVKSFFTDGLRVLTKATRLGRGGTLAPRRARDNPPRPPACGTNAARSSIDCLTRFEDERWRRIMSAPILQPPHRTICGRAWTSKPTPTPGNAIGIDGATC